MFYPTVIIYAHFVFLFLLLTRFLRLYHRFGPIVTTFANEVNMKLFVVFMVVALFVIIQIARKLKCELDNSKADFAAQQLRK